MPAWSMRKDVKYPFINVNYIHPFKQRQVGGISGAC